MATLTASTYAQLATNIESSASGDIIQLQNDINVNRESPQGVTTINLSSGTAKTITITGAHAPQFKPNFYYSESNNTYTILQLEPQNWTTNYNDYFILEDDAYIPVEAENYKILNLSNVVGATSWIVSNGVINFDNIDFQNIILNGCHFITLDTNGEEVHVNHCRFTGSRSGESFLFNVAHGKIVELISSAFDVPWQGANVPQTDAALAWTALAPKFDGATSYPDSDFTFTADYCRFHEHYTGWSTSTGTTYASEARCLNFSCEPFILNGCYIYGDMAVTITTAASSSYTAYKCRANICSSRVWQHNPQKAQNVCDVVITGRTNSTTTNPINCQIQTGYFFGIFVKKHNSGYLRDDGQAGIANEYNYDISAPTKAQAIYVTEAEFADDDALFRKGFDIIVPVEE